MIAVSWNEIRDRALRFSLEWANATDEERDKQTFWNEFFEVFGVPRKSVATFEKAVATARGSHGFIDLFWRGVLLVEHKSAGQRLSKAESQAFDYIAELTRAGLHDEVPRYVIVSDFQRIVLFDLEPGGAEALLPESEDRRLRVVDFPLSEFPARVREFAFIKGETPLHLNPEDPANLRATQLLADLHDALTDSGFTGHALERVLVRILFCLFAEDTGIFDVPSGFTALVERTREDGSDLGLWLAQLFQVLNTPEDKRQTSLDEDLAAFPYVNGALFEENLPFVSFTSAHRTALLRCTRFHWARISPAVFGSLFQGVLDARERRQAGAHYTSERDIMKVIRGLFLDELRAELDAALADRSTRRVDRLREFQKKLRRLRFFDPACGCGNFLILAYRELRRLEQEALIAIHTVRGQIAQALDVGQLSIVDVDQFYGLEIAEWPVRIAEVGLWLADHQANQELAAALGQSFRRLPLKASPTLRVADALRTDWKAFLPPSDDVFVLGNPPFVGHQWRTAEQQADMALVWGKEGRFGRLDYVTAWYRLAAHYIEGTRARCAFVSTNSICQGEQTGTLWSDLLARGIKIHFAHRTFTWESEARGKAHVHVVIVGFGDFNIPTKRLYDYEGDPTGRSPAITECSNINPYLIAAPDVILPSRTSPRPGLPRMTKGSQPTDGGHLILSSAERDALLRAEPGVAQWLRPYIGGEELINGGQRWCLWLKNADPGQLRASPGVMERIARVREARLKSPTTSVREFAARPALFTQDRQPDRPYLAVPEVSSEARRFIPMAFLGEEIIASNKLQMLVSATTFHFGVLSSSMHMAWMRIVSGRLESRYSYAPAVYDNFPWPDPSDKEREAVEEAAKAVLDARAAFPEATLADLYDPLTMPAPLAKAHAALDRAVDRCYRREAFGSDRERVEHLFALYERLATPLLPADVKKPGRRGRGAHSS